MVAVDTSTLSAFLIGEDAPDVHALITAIEQEQLILPPMVISEILSANSLADLAAETLLVLPRLNLPINFWETVGKNRRILLNQGLKARLADSMIATLCIMTKSSLIARDGDYKHFEREFALKMVAY